jgi:hypothetical protein
MDTRQNMESSAVRLKTLIKIGNATKRNPPKKAMSQEINA